MASLQVPLRYPYGTKNFMSLVSDVIIMDRAGIGPGDPLVPTFIHTVRFDNMRRTPGTPTGALPGPPYMSAGDGVAAEPVPRGYTVEFNDIRCIVAPSARSFAGSAPFDPFDNSRFTVFVNGAVLPGWESMPVTSVIHFGKDVGIFPPDFYPFRSHVESSPRLCPETIVLMEGQTMEIHVMNEGATAGTKEMYVNILAGGVLLPGMRSNKYVKAY